MIANAIDQTDMVTSCQDCGGSGEIEYEEDEDGNIEYETCSCCNGEGTFSVDMFNNVSFYDGLNDWTDEWNSKYYNQINSDIIDDLTNQSHTHSVVLDAINKNVKESIKLLKNNGYRLIKENTIDTTDEDILIELEELLDEDYYPNDVADIMQKYASIIADMVSQGFSAQEIKSKITKMDDIELGITNEDI